MLENVTRHQWISESAYYKSEARGFAPGRELDDWLAAENDYARAQIALYLATAEEDGGMTLAGLHRLAQSVGVEGHENIDLKTGLIQAIQAATHHRPCFHASLERTCTEGDCQWRAECKKLIAAWCQIDR